MPYCIRMMTAAVTPPSTPPKWILQQRVCIVTMFPAMIMLLSLYELVMCKLQTYPLSKAGTNCPSKAAMTRAAPLLSKVPCCRRFFTNSDITNSAPVMPVTRPAMNTTFYPASQPDMAVDQTCHVLRSEHGFSLRFCLSLGNGRCIPLKSFTVDQHNKAMLSQVS